MWTPHLGNGASFGGEDSDMGTAVCSGDESMRTGFSGHVLWSA